MNMEEFGGHYTVGCLFLCSIVIILLALFLPDYGSGDSDAMNFDELCERKCQRQE